MVSDEPARTMIREFRDANWTVLRTDGRHTMYGCPCGRHRFPLPDSHRTISVGVVRKARKAIADCQEGK